MPYIKKRKETLCWSCEKACGTCQWASSAKPIPNWDAEETFIRNESSPSYASYLVKSCPEYQATTDFYGSTGELFDLIIKRTGKSSYAIKNYPEVSKVAFFRYTIKYPRSMEVSDEERNAYLTKCWDEEYNKMRKEKKYQKN